jgi:hypothetical protein
MQPSTDRSPGPDNDTTGDGFARYRAHIEDHTGAQLPRVPRGSLSLALVLTIATTALAFAPWVGYQNRAEQDAFRRGIESDGLVVVLAGAIALVALGFAWFRGPGDGELEMGIAGVANLVAGIAAGFTWLNIESFYIDDYKDPSKIHPDWGVMAATIVAILAAAVCLRLWWVMRQY